MALIVGNVFRPLGLPATATPRETRRVVEELAVLSSLGKGTTLEPEALSQLRQTLDDPPARLRAELYWFHSSMDVVSPKIDLADQREVGAVEATLRAAAGRGASREQAIALHDLAVLKYANDVENGQADDESAALACWADVWASDEFWAYMADRAHQANDVRLNDLYLEELRRELPAAVLGPVGARASSFVDADDIARASVAIRAIRRSGMPATDVEVAVRTAVSPLRTRVEAGIDELNRIRHTMSASAGDNAANRDAFGRAKVVLTSQVLAPYERLCSADPMSDAALGDKVAGEVRGLGVSAYNVLEDWDTAYLLARAALALGRTADALRGLARDQATAAVTYHQHQANKATAARRYAQVVAHLELAASYADEEDDRQQLLEFAHGARVQSRLSADAVSSAKMEISTALDGQLATFMRELETAPTGHEPQPAAKTATPSTFERRRSAPPSSGKSPARRLALVVVAVLIVVGGLYGLFAVVGSDPDSTSSRTASGSSDQPNRSKPPSQTSTPAAQPSSQSPTAASASPEVSAACMEIDLLESALSTLEQQVQSSRLLLKGFDALNARKKTAYQSFLNQHPEQYLSSADYVTYQRLRSSYKAYEAEHNRRVRKTNALIDTYNSKLRRFRQLSRKC